MSDGLTQINRTNRKLMHKHLFVLKSPILTTLLFISLSSSSQKDENNIDITKFDVTSLSIPTPVQKIRISIPVSSIRIYDSRFDTTCLGIAQSVNDRLIFIQLKNSLTHEVKKYYDQLAEPLQPDGTDIELSCFIKKLILSNHIYVTSSEEHKLSSKKFDIDKKAGILFMTEFYAKRNDAYIPLCRFDTVLTGNQNIAHGGGKYLENALIAALQKAGSVNWEKISISGRKLSWQNINDYNVSRFNLPILSKPMQKGIYRSFEDFKNNKPSSIEFSVDKNKTGDYLYVKNEKGEDILFTDLWGYCDGQDMFIFSANNYFKLHRSHNGFKIYGAKDFSSKRNLRANFGLLDMVSPNSNYAKSKTATKYYLAKNFFQLDMESGELY